MIQPNDHHEIPRKDGGLKVELHGITLDYGSRAVIDNVSLQVRQGECLALVGPSGAGKTTLLRVMAGLEPFHDGKVLIDGQDVTATPARQRQIGFMFQNYALFRHMSVAENVAFGLRILPWRQRPSRQAIREKVENLLTMAQVPELAARKPDQLSGGQRQRVALARALATQPRLLLLDEPFGALDPMVRRDIRTWLRDLHERLGLTTIFVTHDRADALELADRMAVLRAGRLEQIGTADELEHQPVSPFVTNFLGDALTFAGTVHQKIWHPQDAALQPIATPHHPDGPALALIRPYEIALEPTTQPHGACVVAQQTSGAYHHITLDMAGRRIEVWEASDRLAVTIGEYMRLRPRTARIFAQHPG